jgi:diguanylate cyclase (GGDEF)-like protein
MMDLDGFKHVNDRYGHLTGDRFLQAVGDVIRASLRSADIPCRWGGEEFCILLPETDEQGATVIAERICRAIRRVQLEHEGRRLGLTASLGVATLRTGRAGPLDELIRLADEALYRAKRAGKDRVVTAEPSGTAPAGSTRHR